jgi:uncharacterized protein GlcG (DUF336 family)
MKRFAYAIVLGTLVAAHAARAEDATVTYKSLAPDIALELARAALQACRANGYQIAVVVMDRFGEPLVMLRDRFAGLPAPMVAASKAYTAISFRMNSGDFAKAIQNGQLGGALTQVPHVVAMTGGLVIEAGGSLLGAVGVAGAPGGDKDEACAKAGLDAVRDKLDF